MAAKPSSDENYLLVHSKNFSHFSQLPSHNASTSNSYKGDLLSTKLLHLDKSVSGTTKNVNLGFKKQNRGTRQLTHEEEADHREKNLCFYCHEKLSHEHNCLQRKKCQPYYIEVDSSPDKEFEEIKEIEECENEQPLTSPYAIEGHSESRTEATWQEPVAVSAFTWLDSEEFEKSHSPLQLACTFAKHQGSSRDFCTCEGRRARHSSSSLSEYIPIVPTCNHWSIKRTLCCQQFPTLCDSLTWFKGCLIHMLVGSGFIKGVIDLIEANVHWTITCLLHQKVEFENLNLQLAPILSMHQKYFEVALGFLIFDAQMGFVHGLKKESPMPLQSGFFKIVDMYSYGLLQVLCFHCCPTRSLLQIWYKGELTTMLVGGFCFLSRKGKEKCSAVLSSRFLQ